MKRSFFGIIFIFILLLIMATTRTPQAKVTGLCSNCHTMHNSQGGAPMATYGSTNPENPGTGPKEFLARGTCFGCHGQVTANNIETIGGSDIPQVYHTNATDLAAGNFYHITKGSGSDAFGHNIKQLANAEDDADLNNPPGDQYAQTGIVAGSVGTTFTCAGAYGCHGDRGTTGNWAAMKGAHHTDDTSIDGLSTGTSYRFLNGVLGLENPTSSWQNVSSTDHNEYKGINGPGALTAGATSPANNTISGLCAECHGYYHGTGATETGGTASPWKRHPSDFSLPTSGEYASYTTYSVVAPVARVTITGSISGTVDPTGTDDDIIMCLSCHGAHATANYKFMRWDYKSTTLSTALSGCNVCHTSKN